MLNTCAGELLTELQVDSYVVNVDDDLGEIVLVKLQMKRFLVCDDWYCRYITVKTPSGQCVEFPCFRWLVNDEGVVLRDGRGAAQRGCSVFTEDPTRGLTVSNVCCSNPASGRQERPVEGAQAGRAEAEERNLQASSFYSRVPTSHHHLTPAPLTDG